MIEWHVIIAIYLWAAVITMMALSIFMPPEDVPCGHFRCAIANYVIWGLMWPYTWAYIATYGEFMW